MSVKSREAQKRKTRGKEDLSIVVSLVHQVCEATQKLERELESMLEETDSDDLMSRLRLAIKQGEVSGEALEAFAETIHKFRPNQPLTVAEARRAALIAVADSAWEKELGQLFSSAEVAQLLGGVSRQRVSELARDRRLIVLRAKSGRMSFPAFQFREDETITPLVDAFWTVAEAAGDDWTAASWLVAEDELLDGESPVSWARAGGEPERLLTVARRDAARFAQ